MAVTDPDYLKRTDLGKTVCPSVAFEAWYDEVDRSKPGLWLQSSDGDLVLVPYGEPMERLKKLIRRGRNP